MSPQFDVADVARMLYLVGPVATAGKYMSIRVACWSLADAATCCEDATWSVRSRRGDQTREAAARVLGVSTTTFIRACGSAAVRSGRRWGVGGSSRRTRPSRSP